MTDPATLHAEQAKFWNSPAAGRWITNQQQIDLALAPVAEAGIKLAAPRAGESVLDIGCGSGATAIALARLVGPAGRVTGIDVSTQMLELARRRSAGIANLDWLLADAASTETVLPKADLMFSRFGVMFFGDPVAAFTALRRSLKPGGRLVFASWRPIGENPWMLVPLQAVQPLVPPQLRPGPHDPGPFAFADAEWVAHILTSAGFARPRHTPLDFPMLLGGTLEEATEQSASMGAAARLLREQPEAVVASARAAIRAALAPYARGGRVALPGAVWLVESGAA